MPRSRVFGVVCVLALMWAVACFSGCRSPHQMGEAPGSGATAGGTLLDSILRRGKIVVGVKFDSKPFGYLDTDGQVKGYDVDLVRELAGRLSRNLKLKKPLEVEFQQVLSSTRIIGLNLGKLDLVAATMTITPERETVIDFSDPYYTAHQRVLVAEQSPYRSVRDLARRTILYVIGATSEQNIRTALPQATFQGFKSSVDAFSALKARRGDAMTSDDTILYGFIGDTCTFRLLPEPISKEPYGLGIRQDNQHQTTRTFREAVNRILKDMKADGTLEKLQHRWMSPYEDLALCRRTRG